MKNDNAHAIRLYQALQNVVGDDVAEYVAANFPLGKSADVPHKAAWATKICNYLETSFDADTVSSIRQLCPCNNGATAAKLMKMCMQKTTNIHEFVELFNQTDKSGGWLEYVSEHELLLCYPTCFCACIKRNDEMISSSWCQCSVGYAKRVFEQVVEVPVTAELVSSVKSGAERCAIRVNW